MNELGLKTGNFSKNVTLAAKGAAIILMLLHHLFVCFPDWYEQYNVITTFVTDEFVMRLSLQGKICVAVFVLLSAYGMTIGFKNKSEDTCRRMIIRRYVKLVANFVFVYFISILTCWLRADRLSVYGWAEDPKRAISYMVFDGLGLASFMGTPTYNETWWYMSVAIFMIFLVPILIKCYEKFGLCMVPVSAMASMLGMATDGLFTMYLFTAVCGICMAKESFLEKLGDKLNCKKIYLMIIATALLGWITFEIRLNWGYVYWIDAIQAVLVVFYFYLLVDKLGFEMKILQFLGKHSMNIFLIHTLMFEYYFADFIYSFHHWLLITVALLVTSVIGSMLIEVSKKPFIALFRKTKLAEWY